MTVKDSAADGESMSEEVIDESPLDDDTPAKSRKTVGSDAPSEYLKQKKVFSGGSLLPTEVCLFSNTFRLVNFFISVFVSTYHILMYIPRQIQFGIGLVFCNLRMVFCV